MSVPSTWPSASASGNPVDTRGRDNRLVSESADEIFGARPIGEAAETSTIATLAEPDGFGGFDFHLGIYANNY